MDFGGSFCSAVTVQSPTEITCTTTSHSGGTVNIVITNTDSDYGFLGSGFTYEPGPSVTSISPTAGLVEGDTSVIFVGKFRIRSIGKAGLFGCGSVSVISSTQISCTTPSATGIGSVDVVVTNPDSQTYTLSRGFSYETAPTLSYSAVIGTVGVSMTVSPTLSDGGGLLITDCSLASGVLPEGLSINKSTCVIS